MPAGTCSSEFLMGARTDGDDTPAVGLAAMNLAGRRTFVRSDYPPGVTLRGIGREQDDRGHSRRHIENWGVADSGGLLPVAPPKRDLRSSENRLGFTTLTSASARVIVPSRDRWMNHRRELCSREFTAQRQLSPEYSRSMADEPRRWLLNTHSHRVLVRSAVEMLGNI